MKVAIVSADTMIYRKQKDDTCSPIVRRVLDQVSFKTELVQPVPNDREVIRKILAKIADAQMADLILTIGGIGCREEDCVPEATKAVVDKEIPGIGESMRLFMTRTRKRAMLTRGTAGIRGKSLIVREVRRSLKSVWNMFFRRLFMRQRQQPVNMMMLRSRQTDEGDVYRTQRIFGGTGIPYSII